MAIVESCCAALELRPYERSRVPETVGIGLTSLPNALLETTLLVQAAKMLAPPLALAFLELKP